MTTTQSATATQTATVTAAPSDTGTINLGLGLPLSGAFAASAPYQIGVANMFVDDINAAGGLLGRKVALITRDNTNDPSLMNQVMSQLKVAGCASILGVIAGSDESMYPWATQNRIPVFGFAGDNIERTTDFSKYGFFVGHSDLALTKALASSLTADTNIKSMYMLASDINFAHEVWNALWPALSQTRPDIKDLGQTYVGISESDFSATVNAMIAKKPDYLFVLLGGPIFVNFLQMAKQFDLVSQMKIVGMENLGSQATTPFGADYLVGMQSIDFMPFYLNTPEMTAFTQEHLAKTKLYPDNLTIMTYYWLAEITNAIKQTGSTDPDKLVAALEGMNFTAPTGNVMIDPWDHQTEIPMYWATSGYSKDFPIAIGLNPTRLQAGMYPTQADLAAWQAANP